MGNKPRTTLAILLAAGALALTLVPTQVHAACTSPAKASGSLEYFTNVAAYKICNGTAWETLDTTPGGGMCIADKSREYDTLLKSPKVCNSGQYMKATCKTASVATGFCTLGTEVKLIGSDTVYQAYFGSSVAMSGDTLVIGQPYRASLGSAYVYVRNNGSWTLQQKIMATGGAVGDDFGNSVAISGNTILVAAQQYTGTFTQQGAVYVFTRTGGAWTQQAILLASDPAANLLFGNKIAMTDTTAVFGAYPADNASFTDSGSAYVFTQSGGIWTQQQKLISPAAASYEYFGTAVAISGESIIVGADGATVGGFGNNGAAYVFLRTGSTWALQQTLTPAVQVASLGFGRAVAISGDTAFAGVPGRNSNAGGVDVFTRVGATWTERTIVTSSDIAASDKFGGFLSYSDGYLFAATSSLNAGKAYAFTGSAATWTQQAKFTPSDGGSNPDFFGGSMAASGGVVAIGSSSATISSTSSVGAVYLKPLNFQTQKLLPTDTAASDLFGTVSIQGDSMIVGAYTKASGGTAGAGAAYVFVKGTDGRWTQQAKLIKPTAAVLNDNFGQAVAIYGDWAVVGMPNYDGSLTNQGAAYVFKRTGTTWDTGTQLLATTLAPLGTNVSFGLSVAIYNDTIVVGAQNQTVGGFATRGAAYVYKWNGSSWVESNLIASDGAANDQFGSSVSIYADTIAIGALLKPNGAITTAGAAYIFNRTGGVWDGGIKILPSDPGTDDKFGTAISIHDGTAVVGAPNKLSATGAAYVFTGSGTSWAQQAKLTASDGATSDNFGYSVAVDNNTVAIGAPVKLVTYTGQGAGYIFNRLGTVWSATSRFIAGDASGTMEQMGNLNSISTNNGITVIGAYSKDSVGPAVVDAGGAYIYTNSGDGLQQCGIATKVANKITAQSKVAAALTTPSYTIAAGESLLVCVASKADAVSSVTWNGISLNQDLARVGTNIRTYIYSLPNPTPTSAIITVNFTAPSATGHALTAMAVTGLTGATPLDQIMANNFTATTSPSTGNTPLTTQAQEFIFGCLGTNGVTTDAAGTWTAPLSSELRLGTTGGAATSNATASSSYAEVTTAGYYGAAKTGITAAEWAIGIATYKTSLPSQTMCGSYGFCSNAGAMNFSPGNGMRWCDGNTWRQFSSSVIATLAPFNITGVTGGSDVTADATLTGGVVPTVNFTLSGSATYTVKIKNAAGAVLYNSFVFSSPVSTGISLTNGASYTISVMATDVVTQYAENNNYVFTVSDNYVGPFTISGVTGGTDSTVDASLTSGLNPTVNWAAAPDASFYDVTIKDSGGTTTLCTASNVTASPAPVTGCGLAYSTSYKIYVTAKNSDGLVTVAATNQPYAFAVGPAPTVVKTATAVSGTTATTTLNIVFASNVAVGNTIVIATTGRVSTDTITSVTGLATTWTKVASGSQSFNEVEVWVGSVTTAGTTITINNSASDMRVHYAMEISGMGVSADVIGTNGTAGGLTISPPSITTTVASTLVLAVGVADKNLTLVSGPTNGFSSSGLIVTGTGTAYNSSLIAYKFVTTTGAYSTSWTMSGTGPTSLGKAVSLY